MLLLKVSREMGLNSKVHQLSKNADDDGDDEQMDYNYHFYKEYCRLYFANKALTNRLQQLLNEKQDL
jgi:hypothetical protein